MHMIVDNTSGPDARAGAAHCAACSGAAEAPAGKVCAADLHARVQGQRSARTLHRLRHALEEAADARSTNRALVELVDELQDERQLCIAQQRSAALLLIGIAAAAGYIVGLLHAGLYP